MIKTTPEEMKKAISVWQDFALSMGYTGSYNAGVELLSQYPVSVSFSAPWAVCLGATRYLPSNGIEMQRNPDQCISRLDALKAVTTNVAYMWHEEDRMGSLAVGKLANMAVFDSDFLEDDFAVVEKSKCLATFVDGEQVYKA